MAHKRNSKPRSNLIEQLRKNWIGILGIVIAAAIAWFLYNESRLYRQLIFLVDPVRTEILSAERTAKAPIKVIKRSDGTEVTSDLTSVRFYLWNRGKQSIRRNNVLMNLIISLDDTTGEILDAKSLKVSRPITELKLLRHDSNPTRNLVVDFFILEQNDGMTGQIIYEGNPRATFVISGIIEGVKQIETEIPFSYVAVALRAGKNIGFILGIVLLSMVLFLPYLLLKERFEKGTKVRKLLDILGGMVYIVFLLWIFIVLPASHAVKEARSNVVYYVPDSVLPEE